MCRLGRRLWRVTSQPLKGRHPDVQYIDLYRDCFNAVGVWLALLFLVSNTAVSMASWSLRVQALVQSLVQSISALSQYIELCMRANPSKPAPCSLCNSHPLHR